MKWQNDIGVLARKSAIAGAGLPLFGLTMCGWGLVNMAHSAKKLDVGDLLGVGMLLLLGWWSLRVFAKSVRRFTNIEETAGIAALARFGVPMVVARTIHEEIQHASRELSLGYFSTLILTQNWLVYTTIHDVDIYKLNEFKSLQMKRSADDAKQFEAVILTGSGRGVAVEGPHDKCLLIVLEIQSRHPSINVLDP
jgi:hypothetical protein